MKQYPNYLFDLDGTLINTIHLIVRCFRHSLHYAANLQVKEEDIRSHVGLPLIEQFKIYLGHLKHIDYEDVMREHMEYQLKHWSEEVYVYEGIKKVLEQLKGNGGRLAVVTSRKIKTAQLYTKSLGLFDYFEFLTTPEATTTHKPEPGPALYALERLGADPKETLFIGDAPFDIECGHRAGTDTAFAKWGAFAHEQFNYPPTYTLNTPEELL